MLRAVVERIFQVRGEDGSLRAPPSPSVDFNVLTAGALDHFAPDVEAYPAKLQAVPAMMNGAAKRRRYDEALERHLAAPPVPSDAYLDTFVKIESANFSRKVDPVPRAINPRGVVYNLQLARWLKPQEHRMYAHADTLPWLRPTSTPIILKCYSPKRRAAVLREKWLAFNRPVAIPTDASRFDQHVSLEALQFEHSLYLRWFGEEPDGELGQLLSQQLVNRGISRCRDGTVIRYSRRGGRMSGDMNTALGNCLLMTLLYYGLNRTLQVAFEIADDGDDCVLICEEEDAANIMAALPNFFLTAGFTMEVGAPVDVFEQIEFCQCHPIYNGRYYTMVRDPLKCLSNDLVGTGKWANRALREAIIHLIGQGGGHLNVGIPVLQAFYGACRAVQSSLRTACLPDTGFARMVAMTVKERGTTIHGKVPVAEITAEARVSFYLAYGILPDMQKQLEEQVSTFVLTGDAWVSLLGLQMGPVQYARSRIDECLSQALT